MAMNLRFKDKLSLIIAIQITLKSPCKDYRSSYMAVNHFNSQ